MAFCWRANDGPKLNNGLVALRSFRGSGPVLQRNPIFFLDFQGGPDSCAPTLDPRMVGNGLWFRENKLTDRDYFTSLLVFQ